MTHPTTPVQPHPATGYRPALTDGRRYPVRVMAAVLATITATLASAWFIVAATTAPAHADALCDAMRARFGPGYPCISVPTNTFTPTAPAAPTTTGTTGQSSGGPQVGIDVGPGPGVGNGTPIVPVPGAPTIAAPGNNPTPTTPQIPTGPAQPGQPAPSATQRPPATTPSRPSALPAPTRVGATTPTRRASVPTTTDDGSDQTTQMLWLLAGAAAIIAGATSTRSGGIGRYRAAATANGYPTTIAALRSWLPGGGSERAHIGNSQYVLINDPTSPKSYVFHEHVPPGGHITVNPDGTATIYNKDGQPVSTIAKPWAYDSLGRPQKTWYTVDNNGDLVQHIEPEPNALYPILADPLSGGEDPVTGKSITATPLANGQEAVEGEGNGTQVVGTPDPGRTPYQPDTDTMLPDRQITVDQGNGTTNVTQTDTHGAPSTSNISTEQANQNTAQAQVQRDQDASRSSMTDESGQVWRRESGGDDTHGRWTTTIDGHSESFEATRNGDGTTTVIKDGVEYTYDQTGKLVSDFVPDPGIVVEVPLGPDVAAAAVAAAPMLPPQVKGEVIGKLLAVQQQELKDELRALKSSQQNPNYPSRNMLGRYMSGNGTDNDGKLAEAKALDNIQKTRPDIIRDQKRATFPGYERQRAQGMSQVGRYYDGLLPNGDGTYTGVEIKSGTGNRDGGQSKFDEAVSSSNPAQVTLPNGRLAIITAVRLINVPSEPAG